MNIYNYIKYKLLKFEKPEEFVIGQILVRDTADPFNRYSIKIMDIKENYIQYIYTDGCGTLHSDSVDCIRYLFKPIPSENK